MAHEKGFNYLDYRRNLKLGAKPAETLIKQKSDLSTWYELQATMAPALCENCRHSLAATINFHPRAHICHIVPKSPVNGCPSVATHPLNRWFGCLDCHKAYDEESADVVETMEVIPLLKERVAHFTNEIKQNELRRVPYFLLPETVSFESPPIEKAPIKEPVKKEKLTAKVKKGVITKKNKKGKTKTATDGKKAGPARDAKGHFVRKS